MRRFWWVRHAPTHQKGMVGWSDVPAFLEDAELIGRVSAHLPAAPVISSDLLRSVATADALQGPRVRLPHDPGLRELNFGTWELRTAAEVEAEAPEAIRSFWDDPTNNRPPEGESWDEMRDRVGAAVDGLMARTSGDLIVVAHFGAILGQVQRARRCGVQEVLAQRIDNLSVTCLAFDGRDWHAEAVNHIP
ncbi:histidine phosphatase family protein [Maritimibacter sp. DP1N21-5]|uniref:histidine phosphatase family protein n=1 Tax=Maritimibacter sp. DP1N21-5 TaxID=2836867 RepID=UPI001C466579|nr:histidine phosphatase family protein [Maritimibacter sp. DP1N21-5]MBV7408588.1 histidine phosphatase family protein [Maritimibacter sp. DP1N21-5]